MIQTTLIVNPAEVVYWRTVEAALTGNFTKKYGYYTLEILRSQGIDERRLIRRFSLWTDGHGSFLFVDRLVGPHPSYFPAKVPNYQNLIARTTRRYDY